jgi:hypothetical protein
MFEWLATNLEVDEKNKAVLLANRAIYKWILDCLRNMVMVAALSYVATKSGSLWVWGSCDYCWLRPLCILLHIR